MNLRKSGLFERERSYYVFNNRDGTFHILAVDDSGGFIVADNIEERPIAEELSRHLTMLNALFAPCEFFPEKEATLI